MLQQSAKRWSPSWLTSKSNAWDWAFCVSAGFVAVGAFRLLGSTLGGAFCYYKVDSHKLTRKVYTFEDLLAMTTLSLDK